MIGERLRKGATIGMIAPASCTSLENLESAKKNLEDMGFKVVLGAVSYTHLTLPTIA